jgi:outer membrane lipoprotein LolB
VKFPYFFLPLLILAGCASLPPATPPQPPSAYQQHAQDVAAIRTFALNGRIAVLTEQKGFSGGMRWHHHPEGDEIGFYSPIGTQLGQLSAGSDGVTLTTSDKKTFSAADAETLTQQNLGWSLPISGLHDWVLGRPTQGDVEILGWDAAGHIQHMRQNGWDIEYPNYIVADQHQLPGKIILKSPRLDLKLVIEQWIGIQAGE